jgi:hypothetical protein
MALSLVPCGQFKTAYASDTICGHARIDGHAVGLIGNNGPIQPNGSTKAAQFIQPGGELLLRVIAIQNFADIRSFVCSEEFQRKFLTFAGHTFPGRRQLRHRVFDARQLVPQRARVRFVEEQNIEH